MNRKTRIIAGSLAILMALVATVIPFPVSAQGSRYSLRIMNATSFDIEFMYMSSSESGEWADQLGPYGVIRSGNTFTLTDIRPGEYDIMFVDEDGDSCTLRNQNIFQDQSWRLTNSWLLNCEAR